jgi:prophage maintenance system killer protein
VFLALNGYAARATADELVELTVGAAEETISKAEIATFLRAHA